MQQTHRVLLVGTAGQFAVTTVSTQFGVLIFTAAMCLTDSCARERHLQDAALRPVVVDNPYAQREHW
ncbi:MULTISPECIES: hypothetical protein [unclassified Nocardioides]|uniref:hypothetical protein n=1 Tax=unclassified Nocardioides TaxID=2615069 RepID=UPI000702C35C|nr:MULTISPECIES: hypothetical protein [unclassified Nocardioides]KRC53122.1 hypothetical protein ASE19_12120 [Nocardioides sp. Root79]KRC72650.1 hypothetical protein ASE20_08645 [Nocardioides sp. Root240]